MNQMQASVKMAELGNKFYNQLLFLKLNMAIIIGSDNELVPTGNQAIFRIKDGQKNYRAYELID